MKVLEGKEDWLFLDSDSNHINRQITGELLFTERQVYQWRLLLEMRNLWFQKQKIPYFFLVAPNKACVYSEFLPEHIQLSPKRCITQIRDDLFNNSFTSMIYPLSELVEAKEEMPTYVMRDTHWNDFGAYIGYKALFSEIAKVFDLHPLDKANVEFVEQASPFNDLGAKLDLPASTYIRAKFNSSAKLIFSNNISNTGQLMIFENSNTSLPKAIMFRDSFSIQMLDFVAASFSRLVAVWQPNIDYALVQRENPDVVISQQVERFMIQIPDDIKGLTNEEYFSQKNSASR